MGDLGFMEYYKVISGLTPTIGTGALLQGDYISLKNAQMAWVIFHFWSANGTAEVFSVYKASDVAKTGETQITNVVPIWRNAACATSDVNVRMTDAVQQAVAATATDQLVIFQIDPASLGTTFDCISGYTTSTIAANDILEILYVVKPRYAGVDANVPSVIID
jgi:hypothetical protein